LFHQHNLQCYGSNFASLYESCDELSLQILRPWSIGGLADRTWN
jgi:hypothetical protein